MRLPYSPTPRYSPETTPHPLLTIHQHRTLFLQLLMPPQHLPVGARKVHQQNSFSFLVANSPPRKKKWATLQTVFPPRLTSPTPPNNHRNHQEIRATPKTTNHVCQPLTQARTRGKRLARPRRDLNRGHSHSLGSRFAVCRPPLVRPLLLGRSVVFGELGQVLDLQLVA